MKSKREEESPPELQELLQKPNSLPLIADRRKHGTTILAFLRVSALELEWFSSYLKGRKQAVRAKDVLSNCSHHLYADDLQIYAQAKFDSLDDAICNLNDDLRRIADWSRKFGISVNPSKCQGMFVGSPYALSRFGRKRVLMSMMAAQSILALLSLLIRSYTQYVIVRFVMGFVSVSVVYAAFVLSVELVGGKWVTIAGVCNFFPLPLAYFIVSILSLYLPKWRELQMTLSFPGCLLLLLWFVFPESPRWLLSVGRVKEAKEVLQKAAKFNKRELPVDLDKMILLNKSEHSGKEPSVLLLFKGYILKRTIFLFTAWFTLTIAYYGLLLNIGKLELGHLHTSSIILAIVEVPAIAVSIPVLLKAGRRIPIFISFLVCGVACIAFELFSMSLKSKWYLIACLMLGKFAIGSTNMMLPIFTAELYPTFIRNLGVGASQCAAGLALICIPHLWELKTLNEHLPLVTIAVLSAIGGTIVLLLPETATTNNHSPPSVAGNKKPSFDCASPCNGTFTVTDDRGH
ncbi:solute carrier family 22 member 2-like [Hyposmocoma kahamanoa]|uniref:solute carrier family 22 member 2-like n=1 Tax=Hyposmocoma kahamanoa TaxID=1477025 RepID=UPI000E6D9865|nr:solute carrier family 22 member 2-like [Hyposmocoma kahamanoa]